MYETPVLNNNVTPEDPFYDPEAPYYTAYRDDAASVSQCLKQNGVNATIEDHGSRSEGKEIVTIKIDKSDVLAARAALLKWKPSTPS